jgi:uncharacterized protein
MTDNSCSSIYRFESVHGPHLFVTNGSRIYDLAPQIAEEIEIAMAEGDAAVTAILARYGLSSPPYIDDAAPVDPPVRALSLAIAQKCNLACGYCYAGSGEFGGPPKNMSWEVVRAAIQLLIEDAQPGDRVNLAFLGGEPLINRQLIHKATVFAAQEAALRGVRIGFSITTNGTLLTPGDAAFFEEHGFAITVSLDGIGEVHDRLRPFRGGEGTYERIISRVGPLLARQKRMQVSARVTVTPLNAGLLQMLDRFIGLGFHSVGFAPVLSAPMPQFELQASDLEVLLEGMIGCGRKFEQETLAGRRYPFSNMTEALRQIHRGTHRPYPCGAGAGYFGVSADGGIYACHRFVENAVAKLGDVSVGLDREARRGWLTDRHVHRQEPCSQCWARYLCGGGCHHDVVHRGRPACDFIRGWLHYCLTAYVNLSEQRPEFFAS